MSVHQTPDGRWFVAYPKGVNRADPERTREYFGRGAGAELEAHGRNLELGLGTRTSSNTTEATFAALTDEYIDHHGVDMQKTSLSDISYKLRAHILPAIGHLPGSKIGPMALDLYVKARIAAGRKKSTIHRELTIIKAILMRAVKRREIPANPMQGYQMPTKDDAIIHPPSAAEFAAIYQASPPHLQRAITLAYYTGMRPGGSELFALRWEHVDMISGTIFVESAKKGGMRARVVPIAAALADHLEAWLDQDRQNGPLGWVVHYRGHQVGHLNSSWRRAKARAGITRRIRLYDLRHMAATDMLANGADLKSVSEILGHASPDMTLRIYQHTCTAQRRTAVEMLGAGQCLPPAQKITAVISEG